MNQIILIILILVVCLVMMRKINQINSKNREESFVDGRKKYAGEGELWVWQQ